MKNNMFKKIISISLATTLISSLTLTAFATESGVNDFRVTDEYTALTYGSANNNVLQYTGSDSGVVLTADGASINTTGAFTITTREDILDSVATCENIEFAMTADVTSCGSLVISASNGESAVELYNAAPAAGTNVFAVSYAEGTATLLLNGETVKSETVATVPQIIISGSNAVMEISGVTYGEAVIPETEAQATIRTNINAATDSDTMETALLAYLADEGKDGVYSSLPDCDKTEIKNRMLAAIPFESREELVNGYQKALEYTTQVDLDAYNKVFAEDFSNLDSGWTKNNVIDAAIGSGKANGTARPSLGITDEANSFMFFGGALNPKAANYIQRNVENPKSVITMYMKVANNNALSFSATFDGSQGICLKNTGVSVHTLPNASIKDTGVDFSASSWNKIVFDGTEDGKVKCYVNDALAATYDGSITSLAVGTIFNFASYSVIAVDNITIAEPKTAQEYLVKFNESAVTAEKLTYMLGKAGVSSDVFGTLPECDKAEIVSRMETARPFADVNTFKATYQKALEYTTQADLDSYSKVWSEDFSQGLGENWTVGGALRNNAIGTNEMIGSALPRKYLNISGIDTASAGFVGSSFNNGSANYIERAVGEKNAVVTLYFYDTMYNNKGYFSASVGNGCRLGLSGSDTYYTKHVGAGWKLTNIARSEGWHKIVFDGATMPGVVTVYMDGVEVFQTVAEISQVSVGNPWADASYYCAWVDNITVSKSNAVEAVKVSNKGVEITDNKLPDSETVNIAIENPTFATEYVVATYNGDSLKNVFIFTKAEQKNGTLDEDISISDVTEMKIFAWDDITTMKPVGDVIHLTK